MVNKKGKKLAVESLNEYLSRGGSINKVASHMPEPQQEVNRNISQGGPAVLLSLEEAELMFGQPTKKKPTAKPKPTMKIDLNVLPPALRAKYITKLKEEINGEGYEEDIESLEECED